MINKNPRRKGKRKGNVLLSVTMLLGMLVLSAGSYLERSAQAAKASRRQAYEIQTSNACEAGVQAVMRSLWRPFKTSQRFTDLDSTCDGASVGAPKASAGDVLPGRNRYSAGVIGYTQVDGFTRRVVIRSVGWVDTDNDGIAEENEAQKIVDVTATYQLSRSQVFDYSYFINNYGWMDGFGTNSLIVNGDMRANGDFKITNGSPTINGSVIATANEKLIPPVTGVVQGTPVKNTNDTYRTTFGNDPRARQAFSESQMGAKTSAGYRNWQDSIFESSASVVSNELDGSAIQDSTGSKGWQYTSTAATFTTNLIDPQASKEVVMPDLSDLAYYQNLSNNYVDNKSTYADGAANPDSGRGAYLQVWNGSAYQTISTNGVVSGSAYVVGSSTYPIKVHGPVTFTQDCVIKGYIQGQGTIYTGRNVHLVGSLIYKNAPDFRGSNIGSVNAQNEKADAVALAARGSVIMGNVSTFGYYPLNYMTPPFTKARKDDAGNTIPAYDATQTDSTGFKRYQSVMGDSFINSVSSGINQIDAVLYTNFVGGGNLGTSGGGVTFNGSIISKDESMVLWSLPMKMNYDNRIKERQMTQNPLVDLQLPRSPVVLRSSWQDRGFFYY